MIFSYLLDFVSIAHTLRTCLLLDKKARRCTDRREVVSPHMLCYRGGNCEPAYEKSCYHGGMTMEGPAWWWTSWCGAVCTMDAGPHLEVLGDYMSVDV